MANRVKWAAVFAGVMAAAVIGAVSGCMNPLHPAGTAGAPSAGGPVVDAPSAGGGAGIAGEDFTVTLRVGEDGGTGGPSRAVTGPDAGGIQFGAIRNIAQVIAVDAETGEIADFQQALREKDQDTGIPLKVHNLWAGKRYHFMVLMGHRERDYAEEAKTGPWTDTSPYIWKDNDDDVTPTLLAAGFLADQTIPDGGTTIAVTMKPLVVDTAFEYGGVTAQAALPVTELPSGVGASLAWTITGGGLAALADAQKKAGSQGVVVVGPGWGEVAFKDKTTILILDPVPDPPETPSPPVLGGPDHNRIVLPLGARDAGVSGSASFNLKYVPFSLRKTDTKNPWDGYNGGNEPEWIIRNGINDLAQNAGTVFPNPSAPKASPWNGTAADKRNGNGAVAFTAAQGSVDLTSFVPAPSVGATPTTSFFTSQYIGKVEWTPNHSTFQAGVEYRALVTLEPAAGFVFSAKMTASHGVADSVAITHEYDLSAYVPVPRRGYNPQWHDNTDIKWVDYSTDKWTIHAYWYSHNVSSPIYGDDGNWVGVTETLTGDVYGAAIILTAKPGYSFDENFVFKYPTYSPDNITGPVRGYYKFNPTSPGNSTVHWLWQNGANPTSPLETDYDKVPTVLYYTGTTDLDNKHPTGISSKSKEGNSATGKIIYKTRDKNRLVMVGFNTQDTVPVPVSPPSGGPEGGVRIATLGFKPLGIPSNIDSGGATFAQAVAMISAAQQTGAGYLSLKLNGLTAANTGTIGTPDESGGGGVAFSTTGGAANSPPSVVIDGGNRVLGGALYNNSPFITVGSGVTLTLRNITLRVGGHEPVIRVEAGGVLILEEGAVIRDHTNTNSGGGGVYVAAGGAFIMKGGEISGNSTTNVNGGAVYVDGAIPYVPPSPNGEPAILEVPVGGAFTMQGGTISGNNATNATNGSGGAVYVGGPQVIEGRTGVSGGTFFMQGGTISGNNAGGDGGGVYVATGGAFVKSNGAIYANTAAGSGSGSAVYVQGGRYRDDTVMGFLDSGKSINAGGWDYPVIPHTYYGTVGTDGTLAARQVDWYAFTAPGGGVPLSVAVLSGPVKVSAYRAYGAPISLTAAPPAFGAGETVYVKVEGETLSSSGNYSIRQGPLLLISHSNPVDGAQANTGTINGVGQVDWYFFTAVTTGTYELMWEGDADQHSTNYYNGDVEVSAYGYNAKLIFGPQDKGKDKKSLGTVFEGETIYVKAVGTKTGTYGIRYYGP
jgi:hypothetical protein